MNEYETMQSRRSLTLYELNGLVRQVIELSLDGDYWVEAELSEIREVGGHCYMELVQKDAFGNVPVARASAKCWRRTWMGLRPRFERVTGECLHVGMKLLLRVSADFHEAYGFSWIVSDIDATYTMGEMARRRLEIIRQLKEEGVFDLQRELRLPLFAQRIAVISSPGAAGYGDFCNQLIDNEYGFHFQVTLFSAVMQGEQVEGSVIAALNRINERASDFDVVVIIRGGGATADLSGFDTLLLAENVANFPLPVITGIGHDRDECILDMVSHQRVKTPTAAAAFLIDHLAEVAVRIEDARKTIVTAVTRRMDTEQLRLRHLSSQIPMLFSLVKSRHQVRLDRLFNHLCTNVQERLAEASHRLELIGRRLRPLSEQIIMRERHRIEMLGQRANSLDPDLLLRRGYSITTCNGRLVVSSRQLKPGDTIITRTADGSAASVVDKVTK